MDDAKTEPTRPHASIPSPSPADWQEVPYLRLFPWARMLGAAGLATDGTKLILAALGLALSLAGWGVLDRVFPTTRPITLRVGNDPLPTPWASPTGLRGSLASAAATVADPPRSLVGPFAAMFAVEPAPGAFWHAVLAALWTAIIWGIIGGAIARVALVQLTTGERLGLVPALRFALQKGAALVLAPLSPLAGVACFAALCAILGLFYRIPSGAVHSALGVLAFLPLLAGLVMAIILIGLAAGWPLMHAAVAAEHEDAFDAVSRSYAYVYQRPGRYLAYAALAWAVGTVGLLVIGTFAHATVRLALWALSIGAPDATLLSLFGPTNLTRPPLAARIHTGWISLVSLLAYGWVYSYFWSASSVLYLLLRHDVDGTDWTEITLTRPDIESAAEPVEPPPASPPSAVPAAAPVAGEETPSPA